MSLHRGATNQQKSRYLPSQGWTELNIVLFHFIIFLPLDFMILGLKKKKKKKTDDSDKIKSRELEFLVNLPPFPPPGSARANKYIHSKKLNMAKYVGLTMRHQNNTL